MALISAQYGADVALGQVFIGSTAAAGVSMPLYSSTTQVFCLWNPAGSGKNAYLLNCAIGFVSGTATVSNVVYAYSTGMGSAIGTAAPMVTFTKVSPVNAYLGSTNQSAMFFAPATVTTTSAPTFLKSMGVSIATFTPTATVTPMFTIFDNINGSLALSPGTTLFVAGNVANAVVADISLMWEEV